MFLRSTVVLMQILSTLPCVSYALISLLLSETAAGVFRIFQFAFYKICPTEAPTFFL